MKYLILLSLVLSSTLSFASKVRDGDMTYRPVEEIVRDYTFNYSMYDSSFDIHYSYQTEFRISPEARTLETADEIIEALRECVFVSIIEFEIDMYDLAGEFYQEVLRNRSSEYEIQEYFYIPSQYAERTFLSEIELGGSCSVGLREGDTLHVIKNLVL